MGSVYADGVIKILNDWLGYEEGDNNWTIFADVLDKCGYYAPQKKQHVAWCGIVQDFATLQAALPYDRSNESKKYDAHYVQYQPDTNCYSAGAKERADYYKKAGAWFADQSKCQMGDEIFFNVSGKIGHVGRVEAHEGKVITTLEGNAGNILQRKWYDEGNSSIAGFGRPRFDGLYTPKAETKDTPADMPTPTPSESAPSKPNESNPADNSTGFVYDTWRFVVATETDALNIRIAPNTKSATVGTIPKGTPIECHYYTHGEKVNNSDTWYRVCYNGVNGWVAGIYLKPQ